MKKHTSINHYTGREQQALLRLKNKIVALYRPLIVYLIGCNSISYMARNCFNYPRTQAQWQLSCDLLLVLPEGAAPPENETAALKGLGDEYENIHLIRHPVDFVAAQLQAYSLFFCWIQRSAIVLYEKDNCCAKLPTPVQYMKQYEKQASRFFTDNPAYEGYTEIKLDPLPVRDIQELPAGRERDRTLIASFQSYLECHPPQKVNRNIRGVFMEYLRTSQGDYPLHFKEIVHDFTELMELFDTAEDAGAVEEEASL